MPQEWPRSIHFRAAPIEESSGNRGITVNHGDSSLEIYFINLLWQMPPKLYLTYVRLPDMVGRISIDFKKKISVVKFA